MNKILCLIIALCLTACTNGNKTINTASNKSIQTVQEYVAKKPECSDVAPVCIKEIESLQMICNNEIRKEKGNSHKMGFLEGIISTLVFLIAVATIGGFIKR